MTAALTGIGPGARVTFYVVLALFVVGEWWIRLRSRLNRGGSRADRGSLLLVVGTVAVGLVGAFLATAHLPGAVIAVRRPLFVVGLALMVAGLLLRHWAVALLGRSFTVEVRVRPGQHVVDRGPYRGPPPPLPRDLVSAPDATRRPAGDPRLPARAVAR